MGPFPITFNSLPSKTLYWLSLFHICTLPSLTDIPLILNWINSSGSQHRFPYIAHDLKTSLFLLGQVLNISSSRSSYSDLTLPRLLWPTMKSKWLICTILKSYELDLKRTIWLKTVWPTYERCVLPTPPTTTLIVINQRKKNKMAMGTKAQRG